MHDHSHTVLDVEQLECLRGCSQYAQYYRGRKAFEGNYCPFCTPDLTINTVIYDRQGWIAWEVPQSFTTRKSALNLRLVFFPKRHHRDQTTLSIEERLGYFGVIDWTIRNYNIRGGGIINRFGDMRYNAGTIRHMHATIMVPNLKGKVIIPLAKSAYWRKKDTKRTREFAARYEAGEVPQ